MRIRLLTLEVAMSPQPVNPISKPNSHFFPIGIPAIALWLFSLTAPLCAQTDPVLGLHENTPRVQAFTNARIVVKPGKVLEGATLVVRDDTIVAVGADVAIPADAVVFDLSSKTIYPGLIDLYTDLGMEEATPSSETPAGARHWNKHVQAQRQASLLLGGMDKEASALRQCGFGAVVSFPQDGIFKGSGALILLMDAEPRSTVLAPNVAQGVSLTYRGGGYPSSMMGRIALIRQTLLDTQWYEDAWMHYRRAPLHQKPPETNVALAALQPYAAGIQPMVMEVGDELGVLRAAKLAREFGLQVWAVGSGAEYRRVSAIRETGLRLIVPLNFPEAPEVSTVEKERKVTLRALRHWDFAPENPARLAAAQIPFVLTSATLKSRSDFLKQLRVAVQRGLAPEEALAALTTRPAQWLGLSATLGTLEQGKLANFFVTDGDLFVSKTRVMESWVTGHRYRIVKEPDIRLQGDWTLNFPESPDPNGWLVTVKGKPAKPEVSVTQGKKKAKAKPVTYTDRLLQMSISGDVFAREGIVRITGLVQQDSMRGQGLWNDGTAFVWQAERVGDPNEKPDKAPQAAEPAALAVVYPEGAFGRPSPPEQPAVLLVKNATVWTCGPHGLLNSGDLLIRDGKIVQLGKNLVAPEGAVVVDATGKHLTPGLIDDHSHIAIQGGVNEGTHAVTSEVRIQDVINSDDISIYRQLAGGLTTACTIHGSANPIGGTYAVIKLKWGALPEEMLVTDAKSGIKLALGENVKGWSTRYPRTRMGTVEIIRDAFEAAKDYRDQWQRYQQRSKTQRHLIPPRVDLRMEHLVEVLERERIIHCHAYRQDEIHAMLCLAEEVGFKFDVFIHVLEGYKVAEELRKHGAMATIFTDWWAYKMEAYDAIPFNGALMHRQGIVVSFNSDDSELARRMNTEAAKAVKYGGIPPEEALAFVTLNPAKHLFLQDRIGSLETGKDADFVIWSDHPLSTYTVCEQTWIEGRKYFDLEEDRQLREQVAQQRNQLIQKILKPSEKEKKSGADEHSSDPNDPNDLGVCVTDVWDHQKGGAY
ncbi:amidohydrolase family protein [Planctomycetota bacterium]